MAKFINTFAQGMDQDSSKNKYDNQHYFEAENVRIFSQDGLSGGALEDIEGTVERIDLDGLYLVGYTVLRDDIILFATDNPGAPDAVTYDDYILSVSIAELESKTGSAKVTIDQVNYTWSTPTPGNLVYTQKLGFSMHNPIQAVPRYENEFVKKVYWVDGYNPLRYINTVYNEETNDLENLPIDHLEVIADLDLTQPEIVGITAGKLRSGKIQYAYQLYILNGSKTAISPLSTMIHLTEPSDTSTHSLFYSGSSLDVDTGKGTEVVIPIESTRFTRLRLYAVHFTTFEDTPEIRIVNEIPILPEDDSVTIIDTGEVIGTITLEEFRILSTAIFVPETIETKDNMLFIGNVEEDRFDVEYDARAYRYGGFHNTATNYAYNPRSTSKISVLYNSDDTYYAIYPAGMIMSYDAVAVTGFNLTNRFFNALVYEIFTQATTDFTAYGAADNNPGTVFTCVGYGSLGAGDALEIVDGYILYDNLSSIFIETEIPETADCINRGNNQSYDKADTYDRVWNQRYWGSNDRLGGEGINVSYNFSITETTISRNHDDSIYAYQDRDGSAANFSYLGHASPVLGGGNLVSYQRDEVYRFGIVFFNDKGQSSFVKWIGDIRMPSINAVSSLPPESFHLTDVTGPLSTDFVLGRVLGVIFSVNNIPTDQGITHYQIVRVKRQELDRSIVAQGLVANVDGNGFDLFYRANWDFAVNDYASSFVSPEIGFYGTLEFKSATDTWNMIALQQCDIATYGFLDALVNIRNWRYSTFTPEAPEDEYTNDKFTNPDGSVIHESENNIAFDADGNEYDSERSEHSSTAAFIFIAPGFVATTWAARYKFANARWLVNYRRNNHLSRYGGITHSSRTRNEYIVASAIIPKGTSTVSSYRGDTFINYYEHLYKTLNHGSAITSDTEFILFPCESTINNPLRNPTNYPSVSSDLAYLLHEYAGVWTDDGAGEYTQLEDYWTYNTVYSRDGDAKIFIDKPFDWKSQEEFDTRVYASLVKINGEFDDSWLLYPANQFIEVDPQYGPLTALKTVNSNLMFFQTQAFGVLSVNERALLETGNIAQLSLGVADLLSRYDYAKTDIGCSHWRHLYLTPNALYWIDALDKAMFKYSRGPEEVSLMKGMDSWFRTNVLNPLGRINDGMHMWYDTEYREISVTDTDNNWTITYNEVTDSFVTFLSMQPNFVMNYLDKTLGVDGANYDSVHKHNDIVYGERGLFYDTWRDLTLTLLINPSPNNIAIFNNFEWLTESFNETITYGLRDRAITWDSIEMWNDYQGTGPITLTIGQNVKRRMRKWRYTIPRALYKGLGGILQDDVDVRYARIRDTHMFAKFTYTPDQTDDKTFTIHDIITSHTISNK